MDKASIIGVILATIAIGVGMTLKGVSPVALINPAALLIIVGGTAASVFIAFPMRTLKNVPTLFKIIFKQGKSKRIEEIIEMFTEWAELSRREGVLSLEGKIEETEDTFLYSGMQLVVDGQSPDFIRDVMLEKVDAMEERHQEGASIFTQAGTYAPTLGVLGAVIGLIAALGNMEDTDALGHAISAAFVATLLGIFTGYVLWHPFANKLREKSKNEAKIKYVMVEGILSIANGESPQIIKDKLGSYLSPRELTKIKQEETDAQKETA
ncbi:flagellar motor stator protein MotA [Virgibacillus necropolis]|uniref:Flagellar motor protein MotA n=1 Tax=Virgibacillus necropolis TaxID=163877 RepID=A0A221MAC7_9BACI|nr:flagellar motor stator protein MotA [Virgibacillus necropolis]ASN04589.1 flagellar motor protein MotA [Virgibacillus necropolis]